jgi:hypothetical protein
VLQLDIHRAQSKGDRAWQTEMLELLHSLSITVYICEIATPLYGNMASQFRPLCPRMARHNQLQPEALQQTIHFLMPQSRRSMATKKEKTEEDEELDLLMSIPARRSFLLHSKTGRAMAAHGDQVRTMRQEQQWEKVKRAEKQLSISMTDVPQRKRALERIFADSVAENAFHLTSSLTSLREINSVTDQRELIRLHEEEVQRDKAWREARWRAVSLYLFAPPGDVGFFRRLGKLLGYAGNFPIFLLDKFMAVLVFLARKGQNIQLESFAQKRSMESATQDKSKSRDAGTKQDPARCSKRDIRRPRWK